MDKMLKDLNLLDKFLFDQTMDIPEAHEAVLQIIFGNANLSQELIDFFHYIETKDGDFAARTGSERIQKIHTCVSRIKFSEEMGVKYMQSWEEKIIEREQGRAEGEKRKLIEQVCRKLRKAKQPDMIAEELEEETTKIQEICQIAARFAPEYDERNVFAARQKSIN